MISQATCSKQVKGSKSNQRIFIVSELCAHLGNVAFAAMCSGDDGCCGLVDKSVIEPKVPFRESPFIFLQVQILFFFSQQGLEFFGRFTK